jgi:hypothetical protein
MTHTKRASSLPYPLTRRCCHHCCWRCFPASAVTAAAAAAGFLHLVQRLLSYPSAAQILYGRQQHPGRTVLPADDDPYDSYYENSGDPAAAAAAEGRAQPLTRAQAGLAAGMGRLLMKLMDNLEVKVRIIGREGWQKGGGGEAGGHNCMAGLPQ